MQQRPAGPGRQDGARPLWVIGGLVLGGVGCLLVGCVAAVVLGGLFAAQTAGRAVQGILYSAEIYSLTFSPDGRMLAVGYGPLLQGSWGSEVYTVGLWEVGRPQAAPMLLHGGGEPAYQVAFSPDGHWVVAGQQTATLWGLRQRLTPEPRHRLLQC